MDNMLLVDDGTLDTVFECRFCGHRERFLPQMEDGYEDYSEFVAWCREVMIDEGGHSCEPLPLDRHE
jgi:hypothetical protein